MRPPIAVVIAETLEAATEGAALLLGHNTGAAGARGSRCRRKFRAPPLASASSELRRGDVEAESRPASRRIDATYETPTQYHQRHGASRHSWRRGTAMRCPIDYAEPGPRHGPGTDRGAVRLSPERSTFAAPFWEAASAPRA